MATRKKSIRDIELQIANIHRLSEEVQWGEYADEQERTREREDDAETASRRYLAMIKSTPSYKRAMKRAEEARRRGDRQLADRIQTKAEVRGYSQNTYKGLNNG